MIRLIDDQLLGAFLRGTASTGPSSDTFTTGYWYARLCQAVLGSKEGTGVLSSPFRNLPDPARGRAVQSLMELPDEVGLMSLRELSPLIGLLRSRHDLNILGMEVLAAALHLDAEVCLSVPSPRLQHALTAESRRWHILS